MRSSGIAAPASVPCRADRSDQARVARAFVTAALRLAPALPAKPGHRPVFHGASGALAGPNGVAHAHPTRADAGVAGDLLAPMSSACICGARS